MQVEPIGRFTLMCFVTNLGDAGADVEKSMVGWPEVSLGTWNWPRGV